MAIAMNRLIQLLDPDRPSDLRAAALTVLAELGVKEGALGSAIVPLLDDSDAEVRLRAIQAVGRLRLEKALPFLLERLKHGGTEAEASAEAIAQMGAKGTTLLRQSMGKIVPGVRRYIAAALARAALKHRSASLEILVDKDPMIAESAVTAVAAMIPKMAAKERQYLAESLLQLGAGKRSKLLPHAEAGVMRLAGLLNDERVAPLLWARVLPPHPPEARAAALQSLGQWVKAPSKEEREKLFQCAADSDFQVAAPALMILDRLPVNDKLVPGFVQLLRAPDIAARRLAVSKVGDRDDKEVVDALVESLHHPDAAFRREIMQKLGQTARGRKALVRQLLHTESHDEAWAIARFVLPFARKDPHTWADDLFPPAASALEQGDRRSDPLLFVLRETAPGILRERLDQRAQALVKKRDFEKALTIYRILARDPAIGRPIRLGLASVGLKLSPKELDEHARAQDPCLHHFGQAAAEDSAEVMKHLEKTSWLDAEDLYYLGFHFAESTGGLRDFGAEVLRLLIKRFPKSRVTSSAKNKLKSSR